MRGNVRSFAMDEQTLLDMFELTRSNMIAVLGGSSDRQADYAAWREAFDRNEKLGARHIVDRREGKLVGYMSYTPGADEIYINEVQICPECMRNGVTLRRLLGLFAKDIAGLPAARVRTYANAKNGISQKALARLGFTVESRTEKGVRHILSKQALLERLEGW